MERATDFDPKKRSEVDSRNRLNAGRARVNSGPIVTKRVSVPAAGLALGLVCALAATARAESVTLQWDAPPACPPRTRFEAEVRARTPNATFSTGAPTPRTFRVTIAGSGDKFVGNLEIADGSHPSEPRSFDGETCGEVVSALALLTALAIDPNASSAPISQLAPVAASSPPPVLKAPPRAPEPVRAARIVPQSTPWQGAVWADMLVEGWVSPGVAPGAELAAEVWQKRREVLTPGFRLAFGALRTTSDSARWRWYMARFELCPLRVGLGWKLASQTCAGVEAGAVHAEGLDILTPRSSTNGWFAGVVGTGLVFETHRFVAGVRVGGVVPATRYRFYVENPWHELHRVPALGATPCVRDRGAFLVIKTARSSHLRGDT